MFAINLLSVWYCRLRLVGCYLHLLGSAHTHFECLASCLAHSNIGPVQILAESSVVMPARQQDLADGASTGGARSGLGGCPGSSGSICVDGWVLDVLLEI